MHGSALQIGCLENQGSNPEGSRCQPVKPDDHSESVPPLPIPNRTVKRLSADDSADPRVKVGHRQAIYTKTPGQPTGRFYLSDAG